MGSLSNNDKQGRITSANDSEERQMHKANEHEKKSAPFPRSPLAGLPDHTITVVTCAKQTSVVFNGEIIAVSHHALVLSETGYKPVYYFPRKDVRMDLLQSTDHRSHCPFKGDAIYWTLKSADRDAENAVWSYPVPYQEVAQIQDYLAFDITQMDDWHAQI